MFFRSKAADTSVFFEYLHLLCSLIFMFGLFLDGWAHNHLASELETFFTPWHAVFYAGYFLTAVALIAWTLSRRKKFKTFRAAIPAGHDLSLLGALIFLVGGIGDMLWHIAFGIEVDIEALLSPTHLILATGLLLMVTGGMRHFWATRKPNDKHTFFHAFPLILSLLFTLAMPMFMSQFAHYTQIEAIGRAPADPFYPQAVSVLGIMLFSSFFIGVLSLALRRERLPFGSITFILGSIVFAFGMMREGLNLLPAALLAGLIGDFFLEFWYRSENRVLSMRIFSFLIPALYYFFVFLILLFTEHVWWSVHMWAGSIVLAGYSGLLTSLIAWKPKTSFSSKG